MHVQRFVFGFMVIEINPCTRVECRKFSNNILKKYLTCQSKFSSHHVTVLIYSDCRSKIPYGIQLSDLSFELVLQTILFIFYHPTSMHSLNILHNFKFRHCSYFLKYVHNTVVRLPSEFLLPKN